MFSSLASNARLFNVFLALLTIFLALIARYYKDLENLKRSIGSKIHTLRVTHKPKKISVEKLAEAVGVDAVSVWRWETGRSMPEENHLSKLAKFFKIDPGYFYQATEQKPKTILELSAIIERQEKEIENLKSKLEGYNVISPKVLEWFQKNKDFANLMAEVADEHQPGLIASRLIKLSRGGDEGER